MLVKQLILTFINDIGKNFYLRIDDPNDNLMDSDIGNAANSIAEIGVFGNITITGAKIVETTTQVVEI